jgi:hypothetical protein
MKSLFRRIAAVSAIAALLFAQLAVAAFACPLEAGTAPVVQASAPQTDDGCDGMPTPNLCERHCDYGSSSVGYFAACVPALPAAQIPWRVEPAEAAAVTRASLDRQSLLTRAPPPLILLGVLRI